MKSKAWSWFLAPVLVLSVGSAWSEVLDANSDGVVGPHEALEVARLWRQAAAPVLPATSYWSISGNTGTTVGTHFLGTRDDEPLEIWVNGIRALRIVPHTTSPMIIGGYHLNEISPSSVGGTISGGGKSGSINRVLDPYGTVGGGFGNTVDGDGSSIGGGTNNSATDEFSTVSGGRDNAASSYASSIGGGASNEARGTSSTVAGGAYNKAIDTLASIGGGSSNLAGSTAVVSGGTQNRASGYRSAVAGGSFNSATATSSFIGGGTSNKTTGEHAVVSGGESNKALGDHSCVPGGSSNEASGDFSFAAGNHAKADHDSVFLWSDDSNEALFRSTGENQFLIRAAGGVGVGTNSPANQLHVAREISGGAGIQNHVAAVENTSTAASPDVLALKLNVATPTDANNYITFMNSAGNIGSIEGNGSGGVTLTTTGGDFAEFLPVLDSEPGLPEPGELVGLFGKGVRLNTKGASKVLVVSTAPAVLGNRPAEADEQREVPIAFIGQVPVMVRGPVQAGDWIVPSGQSDGTGVAIRSDEITIDQIAAIAGCALESSASAEVKSVKVLVGVPQDRAWRELLKQREARIGVLEEQMKTMCGEVELLKKQMMEITRKERESLVLLIE